MRILLAEDEKSLNRIVTKQLKAAGYSVDSCFDGGEAYDLITSTDYDAAVFDVMMPIMNGFELVKKIRAHGIDTPVLFLTARDSIEARVTGLSIVMNKGVVLSREKIEDHIWNYDYEGGTNVVDVYIRYLRKKIDEGEDIKLIHTVRGAGYVIK